MKCFFNASVIPCETYQFFANYNTKLPIFMKFSILGELNEKIERD